MPSPSTQKYAVWDGRFQPLHLGHVAVIKSILETTGDPLVVMIIESTAENPRDPYTTLVNVHHRPERNPLTFWERFLMLSMVLEAEQLSSRVRVLGIPRPDVYWPMCKSFYPPNRTIYVTDKDEYEKAKVTFWTSLEENVAVISAGNIPAISATKIKTAMKTGDSWEHFLHGATVDFFRAIDGPRRFSEAAI